MQRHSLVKSSTWTVVNYRPLPNFGNKTTTFESGPTAMPKWTVCSNSTQGGSDINQVHCIDIESDLGVKGPFKTQWCGSWNSNAVWFLPGLENGRFINNYWLSQTNPNFPDRSVNIYSDVTSSSLTLSKWKPKAKQAFSNSKQTKPFIK